MKILLIHNYYKQDNVGGEDLVYANELKGLKDKLGETNVIEYSTSNDQLNNLLLPFSIWFSFKHYFKVLRIIKKKNIELVHIHNYYPKLTISVFIASKMAGVKVIHTMHNFRFWCISGTFFRKDIGPCESCSKKKFPLTGIKYKCFRESRIQSIISQMVFWFYKKINLLFFLDKIIVLTRFQKQKLIELGIPQSRLILKPNGIKIRFKLEDLNLKEKRNYIFVGRLEEGKGIFLLLDIWQKLPTYFQLNVVGNGPNFKKIINDYSQDNITFHGSLEPNKTQELIKKSKFLINPSFFYETFGLTIIEAFSSGTPVIGLNIGTRPEFIEDGKNGFLSSKEKFLETIIKSYNLSNYEKLSLNAYESSKRFEWDYVINKQIKEYQNVLRLTS